MEPERKPDDQVSSSSDRLVGVRGPHAAQRARALHLATVPEGESATTATTQNDETTAPLTSPVTARETPAAETPPSLKTKVAGALKANRKRVLMGVALALLAGAGWYGFNLDPARTKAMLEKLDAAFAKAGKKRGPEYEIVITPPMTMTADAMQEYAALGVHRLVVMLGGQKPDQVDKRLPELAALVKAA